MYLKSKIQTRTYFKPRKDIINEIWWKSSRCVQEITKTTN